MKLIIRQRADDDLDDIFAWILKDNPRAAAEMVRRIRERVGRLVTPGLAHMGRPGLVAGTRELVVPGTPYVIPYRLRGDRLEVIAVFHARQKWPKQL